MEYFTIRELSEVSGLSESTLRRRIEDGSLPVIQPGGRRTRMLFATDVLDTIADRLQTTPDLTGTNSIESDTPPLAKPSKTKRGPRPRWLSKQNN